MNEAAIRLEVQHVIRELGFWDKHEDDKKPKGATQNIVSGRPDIYGLNPRGPTCIIEVKTIEPKVRIEPYLDPTQISNQQRNWLDGWYWANGQGFLAVGTLEGNPRRLWIIPWEWWVALEKRLGEKDLFFKVPISMFPEEYECKWLGTSQKVKWELPLYHPLLKMATSDSSPNRVDWKKQYSFRFAERKEKT